MTCPEHNVTMVERTLEILPGGGLDGRWLLCPVSQCPTAHLLEIVTTEVTEKC